jgi:hypothetical protein
MGLTNRDASQITVKNRNKALNAYYDAWKTANVTGSATNSTMKAPASTSAEVVAQIKAGCVACTILANAGLAVNPDPNQVLYPANPSAGGASSLTGTS